MEIYSLPSGISRSFLSAETCHHAHDMVTMAKLRRNPVTGVIRTDNAKLEIISQTYAMILIHTLKAIIHSPLL